MPDNSTNNTLAGELNAYRSDLRGMLALEAAKAGFLGASVKTAAELSSLIRPFFEKSIAAEHAASGHLDPLALLGSCCFAGAAAARLWLAVEDEILKSDLYALVTRGGRTDDLDDSALELAGMPAGTPDGDRFAACVKGSWSIMALAAWGGKIKGRSPEEAVLFLQETAKALYDIGQAIILETEGAGR